MAEWDLEGEAAARAAEIHRQSVIVDMCISTYFTKPSSIIDGANALERALKAGVNAGHQTLSASSNRTFREALTEINLYYRLLDSLPDRVLIVRRSEDILRAREEGKMGLILGFQNAEPLEDDWTNTLPLFRRLGIRVISITYNERNLLGSGCIERRDLGLTAYGEQVVRGMNQMGLIIDLSHVGMLTAMEAIELSEDPVVFTHSNPRALNPHPRNLTDEVIKAAAAKGGVIGAVAWEVICTRNSEVKSTLSDYLDHIDYLVKLVGVDHVGMGSDVNETFRAMPTRSDFDTKYSHMLKKIKEIAPGVVGLSYQHDYPNLTAGLVARGYSDGDIRKILGGNFLRVARQVWDKPLQPCLQE